MKDLNLSGPRNAEKREFLATLRRLRNENPALSTDALVEKAVNSAPRRFYYPQVSVENRINDLVTKFTASRKSCGHKTMMFFFEIIIALGKRYGLRATPDRHGRMIRSDILRYVLDRTSPSSFRYTKRYGKKLFYKYFDYIK